MDNKQKGYVFVAIQFLLIAGLVFSGDREDWPLNDLVSAAGLAAIAVGFVIMIAATAQLGTAFSANPEPTERGKLNTSGLYRIVRHPIYLGLLTAGAGSVARSRSFGALGFFVALSVLLHFKANWEEQRLAATYEDYVAYAAKTAKLVPGVH